MKRRPCANASLELVLSQQEDHPEYAHVVNHIGACSSCQNRLDRLTANESWWSQARVLLAESDELYVDGLPRADTLILTQIGDTESGNCHSPGDYLSPPRHPEMLGRLGKYEVETEIGRGGMGIVLKGFDSELNRPVAIKLLAPHLASSGTARQRFIREARAAAAVVHDNVVAIHGIETSGPLPAIVMPLVSGSSLEEHVRTNGAVEPTDAVRIGIQVASGLAAAHGQGLVHRDIKPANILLENGLNRVQITDFGLARAAHEANLTRSGVIAGTPYFMSPEQALGESIDQRSDLFSLGAVMYFMASGELPFNGSTAMGVLQRVCNVAPRRLREVNPEVPEQLESVIEKLLEKDPANRFESAADVQSYLNDYLAHLQQPTTRQAPRRLVTASKRARRRKIFLGVATAATLCAGAALGGWMIHAANNRSAASTIASAAGPPATDPSPPAPATTVPATYLDLNLPQESELDNEIRRVSTAIARLERQRTIEPSPFGNQTLSQVDGEIRSLETPRRAGQASNFAKEVQSIDAAIRRLEHESVQAKTSQSLFEGP